MSEFPKVIWQTHKCEYEDLPEIYKRTSKTWQVMNPDWEYRYVPNHQMRSTIKELNNAELLEFFDRNISPMFCADVWREAMVYYHGGMWSDLDAICTFPIDNVTKKNMDKEMICISPIQKFGMNPENNYSNISTEEGIDTILSGKECGYWISNACFVGKKFNKISEEIINTMTGKWNFKESSFMGIRAELYDKYHELMSLDLMCAFHDGRFNHRNHI